MSKITESARGQDCLIRVPGICNHNPETVVFCHAPGAGMGRKSVFKSPDGKKVDYGSYGCSACHDAVDGRIKTNYKQELLRLWFYEGTHRTTELLVEAGLLRS